MQLFWRKHQLSLKLYLENVGMAGPCRNQKFTAKQHATVCMETVAMHENKDDLLAWFLMVIMTSLNSDMIDNCSWNH